MVVLELFLGLERALLSSLEGHHWPVQPHCTVFVVLRYSHIFT